MKPIPEEIGVLLARTDWTPAEALQFYADQKNFDIVEGHARILDNGAIASNALKHLSLERLEMKGDAELTELRAELAKEREKVKELENTANKLAAGTVRQAIELAAAQATIEQMREALEAF